MPVIPNNPNTLIHRNLVFTMQDYWFELTSSSTDLLKSAYIIDQNDNIVNPNAPLLSAKQNGKYRFNLKYILNNDALFTNDALPEKDYKGTFRPVGLIKRFKVRIDNADSAEIYFINGNAPDRIYDVYGQNTFTNFRKLGNPFLSFSPGLKLVKPKSVQYLYYLNNLNDAPTTIKLKAKITLLDGSVQTRLISTFENVNPYEIIASTVSPVDMVDGTTLVIDEIDFFEIFLTTNDDEVITERKRFIIDRSFEDDNICILYRNQLGVFETFDFDGQVNLLKDFTFSSFQNEVENIDFETTVVQKIVAKTSALEKGWSNYLSEDLMQSNEIYWLHPDGRRIRLSKINKSLKVKDEKENDKLEIEFKIAKI